MTTAHLLAARRSVRTGAVAVLALALTVLAGCTTLPTAGEVSTSPGTTVDGAGQPPDFLPPSPVAGADRESVVRGFLLAAQANPPSTAIARLYLTEAARSTWRPAGATVYTTSSVEVTASGLSARLFGSQQIDSRGSWLSTDREPVLDLGLQVVRERGEWRIQNPPTALPVPSSYFRNSYLPYLLYFFDRTGTALVPSRVYLPRGEQIASGLVRGLLAGPPAALEPATTSAWAPGVDLELSVVIGDDGVAEVPLSPEVQSLDRADLYQAVVQLAATLRQVPGLNRIRVTVGGVAVPLVNGQTEIGLEIAAAFEPAADAGDDVVAIAGGRVVVEDDAGSRPVDGPLGAPGFALRSIAVNDRQQRIAAVARNGRIVYVAPTTGSRAANRVTTVVVGGSNVLRPSYDRFGNLWVVDAAPSGAVVRVISRGRAKELQVPGISGQQVSAFTITRDGASLVAGVVRGSTPGLALSTITRTGEGVPLRAVEPRLLPLTLSDPATIVGLAQDAVTRVVVLTRTAAGLVRLSSIEVDGSPGRGVDAEAVPVPVGVRGVLAAPGSPTLVIDAEGRLLRTDTALREVVPSLTDVVDATYPQ